MHVVLSHFQKVDLKTRHLSSFLLRSKLMINAEVAAKLIISKKLLSSTSSRI